jgi:hypothetical protein
MSFDFRSALALTVVTVALATPVFAETAITGANVPTTTASAPKADAGAPRSKVAGKGDGAIAGHAKVAAHKAAPQTAAPEAVGATAK